jgi:hypothetical protein
MASDGDMRERLARVVAAIDDAASRRNASTPALDQAVKILNSDYPDADTYARASALPTAADGDRFGLLADVFGLDQHASDLLAVAVAGELDATIANVYDLLTGRALNGRCTVGLALELCGLRTASPDASIYLHPSAALRRSHLLDIVGEGGWLNRGIVVADRVRAYLCGDDNADDVVLGVAVDALRYDCPQAEQVARALVANQNLIWVRSPLGTAGVSMAVSGFAGADAGSLVIDLRLAARTAATDTLIAGIREAGLRQVGLVVAGADVLLEPEAPGGVRALMGSPVPIVAVGTQPWPAHRSATTPLTIDAPHLTGTDRSGIWESALGRELPRDAEQDSVSALRLNPEEVLAAGRYATLLGQARDEELSSSLLRDAARTLGSSSAASSLSVAHVGHAGATSSFADLVLPEPVHNELVRLVRWAQYRDDVLARGTLHTKGGKGGGIAALFTGSPGTGKTLAAHVVADELGLELMQIDLSAIVDKYIGETEKQLERVFRDAESRNVVLFFDEADALFGSRSAVSDAHDRYANQEVSYLLQRMEHFDGITVLATNLRGNLDQAFLRRMQFIVHFPDPDPETRRRLWAEHLKQAGEQSQDDPVNVDLLAECIELAGGDIRNIVLAAAYDAAVTNGPVTHSIVVASALREYQKLGRRIPPRLGAPAGAEQIPSYVRRR